ncbi:hypothetical protein E2C01_081250 [Portunus trituberculatus]|uniref:Uncharacterized protein n=1 Tax=Portunus trituberculatus TaxID=210409 RepID=A0A5B7J1S9_PORTR|nr:hypothetical protein [Portunus trituberculatus]
MAAARPPSRCLLTGRSRRPGRPSRQAKDTSFPHRWAARAPDTSARQPLVPRCLVGAGWPGTTAHPWASFHIISLPTTRPAPLRPALPCPARLPVLKTVPESPPPLLTRTLAELQKQRASWL